MDKRTSIPLRGWPLGAVGMVAVIATCGGLTVTKVPSDQEKAERLTGIRYYLPWPYLAVTKEFPVDVATCFVHGTLTADGKYVDVDDNTLRFLDEGGGSAVQLPEGSISLRGGGTATQPQQARIGLQAAATKTTGVDSGTDAPPKQKAAAGGTKNPDGGTGGTVSSEVSVAGGTGTQPIRLSDSLSIVYLPNDAEQYIVEGKRVLFGSQTMQMQLTSGWMAEGFNVKVDNTEVLKFIESTVNNVLPALEKVIGLQGAAVPPARSGAPQQVVIRVHTVRYAVPGLYPLLHSGELAKQVAAESTPADPTRPYTPCDPMLQKANTKRIGSFVLQTRGDRFLELTAADSAATRTASATPASPPAIVKPSDCGAMAASNLATWAATKGTSLNGSGQPKVSSLGVEDGNVTLAIEFSSTDTRAHKSAVLARLKTVKSADLQSPSCQYNEGGVKVCELNTAGCRAAPAPSTKRKP